MLVKTTRIFFTCFLLLALMAQPLSAQEKAGSDQSTEAAALRAKIEQYEGQVNQLQNQLDQQRLLLAAMQQKIEQMSKPALSPAALLQTAPDSQVATIKTVESKPAPAPRAPQSVETGYGKIKFNGLLEAWYAGGNSGFRDTFRIRRTELKFSGEITPRAKWTVMIDPSKGLSMNNIYTTIDGNRVVSDTSVNQASRILQDAFITFDYNKHIRFNIGQFKVPLSMEGLQSSATLDTVERSLSASDRGRGGNYGDVRDTGVMMYGPLTSAVDYQFGMFSGSGENHNDLDRNDQKALAGRLVARPSFIKGLQVGGSGVWGNGSGPDRPRRNRVGTEMQFRRENFTAKAEFLTGMDSELRRMGYYTHVGYRLMPKIEAVFRFDTWDPDTRFETNATNVAERDFVTGLNYYISENNVKFQINYLRKTFAQGIVPSRNLILVNLQTSW